MDIAKYYQIIMKNIESHGCQVITVPDPDYPPNTFSYSIGFAQFGLPDVIMTGNIPQEAATGIVNQLLAMWRKEFVLGRTDPEGEAPPFDFTAVELTEAEKTHYLTAYTRIYQEHPELLVSRLDGLDMVQIVWPDPEGVFPYENGYDERFIQHLFEKKTSHLN